MLDFFALILDCILDIQYWFKTKKRRKFEKENNLPKSIVWHPLTKPFLILFLILIPMLIVVSILRFSNEYEKKTTKKLTEISKLLEDELKQNAFYPKDLKSIIRNNPLRKNICLDYYKNEFVYSVSKDSLNYSIIAIGKDQKLNTSDDIKITN
ncbi:hypothetical protein [uncultured Polaribacter sp.]|uniref:hypothetical protein n=1 Tax=uncultured Polaribacter sp. TaxID=174711 RepID=UPI0030DC2964